MGGMRYWAVIVLLAVASVPPLLIAAFIVADRLRIHLPGDILVFSAAGYMVYFGLPLSLGLVVCAAALAVGIYFSGRLSRSHKENP